MKMKMGTQNSDNGDNDCFHLQTQLQLQLQLPSNSEGIQRSENRDAQLQLFSNSGTKLRRRNRTSKDNKRRPWADLPQELLSIISNYLTIADFLTFGRVCKDWRKVFQAGKENFMASQSPLIIYISPRAKRTCHFYDIFTDVKYKTKLPYFAGSHFLGISSGYLIMQDLLTNITLVNPVTGHQIKFPQMPQSYIVHKSEYAIVASMGTCSDNVVIVVLSRVLSNLHFCMSRDNQWRHYSFAKQQWMVLDIVVFEGLIFALRSDSQLVVFNFRSCDMMLQELNYAPRLGLNAKLVVSGNRLLVVDFFPSAQWDKVYIIDFERRRWIELEDLGDEALFIGDKMSSKSSKTFNCRGRGTTNCIYHLPISHNYCFTHYLNGRLLGFLPIFQGYAHYSKLYSWYFPTQSLNMDLLNDFNN